MPNGTAKKPSSVCVSNAIGAPKIVVAEVERRLAAIRSELAATPADR